MKKSRFSEEQIIGILRGESGSSVNAVSAKHNIRGSIGSHLDGLLPKSARKMLLVRDDGAMAKAK